MQIDEPSNSLTVRLPAAAVEDFSLQERDEITGERRFCIDHDRPRDNLLARLRILNWTFPSGFRFNRDEANER